VTSSAEHGGRRFLLYTSTESCDRKKRSLKIDSMKETNRIELKRELTEGLEKEVVGFLNSREGGFIYLGVDDNGDVFGLDNLDKIITDQGQTQKQHSTRLFGIV
jgi:predicted HTH transcriptional regulator